VKRKRLTLTIWALRSPEAGIAKKYLDLLKLREEVRRAEISFRIRMHDPKGARSNQRLH
jgi:hypothetical protein